MKNFACLILGMGLLVNATMANLNENDAIDRVKRGSLNFKVAGQTVSATKKNFIVAKIKTLYRGVNDVHKRGKIAGSLSNALKNQFGGRWMVFYTTPKFQDKYPSFTPGGLKVLEYFRGWYGQTYWSVSKY